MGLRCPYGVTESIWCSGVHKVLRCSYGVKVLIRC